MKSNIKVKVDNQDSDKIILSVGMIVKNEEKHLDNCLSALKKLLDNVPSELIIVDTGSTDRTKEIALKYTDKVYDFEWINDFSAARNYGLEKAVGEWFMFIDADEYLDEDCDEMIKFFNMPEVRSQYNSASFYIRNYVGKLKKSCNQFLAPRIVRLNENIRFSDPIHEWIPQPPPCGIFTTIFHHYGYVYESQAQSKKKFDRNIQPLLEEYKKDPTDLRTLYHICDLMQVDYYSDDLEKREKFFKEYLNEAKKRLNEPYTYGAFVKYATFYMNYEKYNEAIKIMDEFISIKETEKSVVIVTIYYLLIYAYLNLEDYSNAYKAILKYFDYYNKYKNNELELVELRFGVLQGLTEYNYEEQLINIARCLNSLERHEEALQYLDKVKMDEMNFAHLRIFLNVIRDLIQETKDYKYAANCYKKIFLLEDDDKTGLILFLLEQYYMEHPAERANFAAAMVQSGVDGPYIELMKFVRADRDGTDISEKLAEFISSINRWEEGYAEAIYLAMKHDVDLSDAISKMSSKILKEILQMISQAHIDYAEIALRYCKLEKFSDGIKKLLWMVTALENAVYVSHELSDDDKALLFDTFISALSDYVMNIYNPELLNLEDVEVLPELHRFGYYMTLAFTSLNSGNKIAYIRGLKEALRLCEPMKDLVSFYLTEFEESLK